MNEKDERGTARMLVDQIRVNNRNIEEIVVKGLTGEGFDVEIVPDFKPGDGPCPTTPEGSTVKVYRKVIV